MVYLAILAVYVALFAFLQYYARRSPPTLSRQYVEPEARPLWVLLYWLGPSLLPVMALLWAGVLRISPFALLLIATAVPMAVYLLFFVQMRLFPTYVVAVYLIPCLFLFGMALPFLLNAEVSWGLLLLFVLSLIAPPLVTLGWIVMWAPAILPLPPDQVRDTSKVLSYIIGFFTRMPKSTLAVVKGKVETRIAGNPFQGTGPGLVMTEPENAVAIKDSSSIRYIAGPGNFFTEANEQIYSVISLLQQVRGTKVTTLTRDGIEVRVPISSIFRIDPGDRSPALGQPLPYDKAAATQALFSAEVDPSQKTPLDAHVIHPWEDLPLKVATHQVKQIVARYSFDELCGKGDDPLEKVPRKDIGSRVKATVVETMRSKGIKVQGGGVGSNIAPVDESVVRMRIENWKAHWIRQVMEDMSDVNVKRVREFEKIRTRARIKLLEGLVDQSDFLKENEVHSSRLIALQLLETLEYIGRDPDVEPLLPKSALNALHKLRLRL